MITNFIKSTIDIFNFFFKHIPPNGISVEIKEVNTGPIQPITDSQIVVQKDKVLFQPNILTVKNSLEFPLNKNTAINSQAEIPINEHKLTIECNEAATMHLNGLCRFFEINQFEAIARGVWLLSVARDIEINNKKLGIISVDQNGFIIDVTPLNIV